MSHKQAKRDRLAYMRVTRHAAWLRAMQPYHSEWEQRNRMWKEIWRDLHREQDEWCAAYRQRELTRLLDTPTSPGAGSW